MAFGLFAVRLKILHGLLVLRSMVSSFGIMRTAMESVLFSSNSEQPLKFDNFLSILCGHMKLVCSKRVDVLL
jgi:hypothetical protein